MDWSHWGDRLGDLERPPDWTDKLVGGFTTYANGIRRVRFLLVLAAVILAIVLIGRVL